MINFDAISLVKMFSIIFIFQDIFVNGFFMIYPFPPIIHFSLKYMQVVHMDSKGSKMLLHKLKPENHDGMSTK